MCVIEYFPFGGVVGKFLGRTLYMFGEMVSWEKHSLETRSLVLVVYIGFNV